METLNTITTNWNTLSDTPIDWSMNGGMVWLTFYVTVCFIGVVVFSYKEEEAERNARKSRIYRAAEESARIHLRMKSEKGYLERRNF
jgi:cbb3-type cytochrome oxidase subunit 3